MINMIVACDAKGGIGLKNGLPWPKHEKDMKWFRHNTINNVVVMGRKTWESIGSSPLKKRVNIVLSRTEIEGADRTISGSMPEIIETLRTDYTKKSVWFIGGANVYDQANRFCDGVYLTQFPETYECDSYINVNDYLRGRYEACSKVVDGVKFSVWSR